MMEIDIRKGIPTDAEQAAPLVLSSAESLLTAIFGHDDKAKALDFLTHAWRCEQGLYGCANHWVASYKGTVVGVITAWHSQLGAAFDRGSLDSVTSFYSLDEAITVLVRNQAYTVGLTSPTESELMVGHVAVSSEIRRAGIGRTLIEYITRHAQCLNKQTLVLDVQLNNVSAIRFYQTLNFVEQTINGSFVRFAKPI